jgi:peptide subunit release factor RF-3
MNKYEIIEMAREAGMYQDLNVSWNQSIQNFAKLVAERERKFYMQLFLDPENQPTQFGTAIEQYRKQEVNDETEMCAEVVLDEIKKYDELNFQHLRYVLNRIYFKIRARGQQ